MPSAYLIQIPNDDARKRAIVALLKVPHPRQVFTEGRMLVMDEHIRVLNEERIPFTYLSERPDGETRAEAKRAASLRS